MSTVVFMQVSHKVTAPHNPVLSYFKQVYAQHPGYHMPEHFMEIPTWIAVLSGMLPDDRFDKVLHIVTDVDDTVAWAELLPQGSTIMMSVMDVNRTVVHQLIQRLQYRHKFILGGYVDPEQFEQYHRVAWCENVEDIEGYLPDMIDRNAAPDYSMFSDVAVIPRLTLSEGCLYNCAFCTIKREIDTRTWENVLGQIEAFRQLRFELVYLDDKTYGQAKNWTLLAAAGHEIRRINPRFRGFIVQTTVPMMLKHLDEWTSEQEVAYVEVGVEHVDEGYLRRMRKPYSLHQLEELCVKVRQYNKYGSGVGFIPNIMFALPDADYGSTIKWVERNRDIISFVNPFILCQYGLSKGALVAEAEGKGDQDENSMVKSWLTEQQVYESGCAMSQVMNLTRD